MRAKCAVEKLKSDSTAKAIGASTYYHDPSSLLLDDGPTI